MIGKKSFIILMTFIFSAAANVSQADFTPAECAPSFDEMEQLLFKTYSHNFSLESSFDGDHSATRLCNLVSKLGKKCAYDLEDLSAHFVSGPNYFCQVVGSEGSAFRQTLLYIDEYVSFDTERREFSFINVGKEGGFDKQIWTALATESEAIELVRYDAKGVEVSKEEAEKIGTYTALVWRSLVLGADTVRVLQQTEFKDGTAARPSWSTTILPTQTKQ